MTTDVVLWLDLAEFNEIATAKALEKLPPGAPILRLRDRDAERWPGGTPAKWPPVLDAIDRLVRDARALEQMTPGCRYWVIGRAGLPAFFYLGVRLSKWAAVTFVHDPRNGEELLVMRPDRASAGAANTEPVFQRTPWPIPPTESADPVALVVSSEIVPVESTVKRALAARGARAASLVRVHSPARLDGTMTDRVVRELDETLRAVHNAHGARSSLAVFVAGPAPLAFFLGNAINPRAVGPVQVFEYDGEYKLAFELPYPPVPDRNRVVLFQSLPSGEPRLELDREIRDLRLGGSAGNDRLEISDVPGARPSDLLGALRSRPTGAIHFSGHGASGALVLEAEDRSPRLVSIAELAESIRIAAPSARLVVLSACYTATDARALLAHVECVVAMRGPIHDGDARRFAVAFYAHLGVGESVKDAFDAACHSMKLDRMTDSRASRARDVLPAGAESTSEAEDPRLVERDPGCARSVYLVRRH